MEFTNLLSATRVIPDTAIPIKGDTADLVKEQKCHQVNDEPVLHVTGCDELFVKLQHPGSEVFVDALMPNAIELRDNHAWHIDPAIERIVILDDWLHVQRVGRVSFIQPCGPYTMA